MKKFLVLGIAITLLALGAGVVFAQNRLGNLDGVNWFTMEGRSNRLPGQTTSHYTQVYNENNYAVSVDISRLHDRSVLHRGVHFNAKETKDFAGQFYISRVVRR